MIRKTALLAVLLASAAPAWAGDKPVYAPAPDWVKPAPPVDPAKIGEDAPVLLVLDQQQRFAEGQVWHYVESAMRIASPQVLTQAGTITLPWSPDRGDLIVHSASILRDGETIDLLAGGKQLSVIRREQKLEQMQLDGLLTATMPVEGLRVGDVLRLRFSTTRKDPTLGGEMQSSLPLFPEPMRVQFGRVRMIWPETAKVNWKSYAGYAKPQVTSIAGGYRELSVSLPIPKQVEMPQDAPARFQPMTFIDATSYAGWAAVARTMAPLYRTQGLIAPDSALAKEVAVIASGSSDQRMRAAAALQLVQDKVRYLFNGMAQGNYVPQSPVETWSLRYGDCKAKTLLLLAILRELGIEAEAVLVHSKLGDLVPTRLPMPGAFDHVIVRAVIGGESLWLDGTSSGDRLADLGNVPPFRHALPLRETGAELIALPARPSARPDVDAEIDMDQSAGIHFPAPFTAKLTMRGQIVQMLRAATATLGKDEIEKMAGGAIDEYVSGSTYTERKLSFDDAAGTVVVTAAGIAYPGWVRENERFKITLDAAVQGIGFEPDRSRTAWRDLPVSTGDPGHARVRISYRLPGGGAGFAFEGDEKLPAQIAGRVLARQTSVAGGVLTVEDRRIVTGAEVAPAEIGAARQQLAQAKTRLLRAVAPAAYPQRWQDVASARKSGAFQKILAAYGQRIAKDPGEADGYIHRAWFYERVFDYPAAIKDMDKAIALQPSVDSHLRRAGLFQASGQLDKAIADADAARELDPGSSTAISTAINLRGEKGQRAEALEMVERQIEAAGKDKPDFLSLKADLLADDGRADEALAVLDAAVTAHPGNPALLNSRCWLKGTRQLALDTALKDCTRAIELSDNPAPALDSRAMVYFRLGRTEEALGDLDAALDTAPDMAAALYMRGVVRKAAGQAGSDTDLAAARMMAPRIDAQYGKWGIKP
ncbi:DUF3857 domain-containing protein [Sphingomonas sp. BT-65]|uniref:DUF3857 domain-containing protein n=1 Tax=Sphingomonas sp. BT-65 TaxID=2989821 RepID=UPI00223678A6|nr:DUF3857 domain-containing protein [Sphingomonas sp. BT-65]MCW4461822.1 DUF3857 domain-containing protein [Sphingomonas sp. BT-65]